MPKDQNNVISLPNRQKQWQNRFAGAGALAILMGSGCCFFNYYHNGAVTGACFVLVVLGWCALAYGLFPWVYSNKRVKKTSGLWMVSGMLKIAIIALQLALMYGNVRFII